MTPMRSPIRYLAFGLAVATILVAAVALPFVVRPDFEPLDPNKDEVAAEDCWGCVPFLRLIELFEFQVTAATPEVAALEQRSQQRNMLPDAVAFLARDLDQARGRLGSAREAMSVLVAKREDCQANEACRLGPDVFQEQTCGDGWPDAQLHNSLTRIADQAFSLGSQCRGLNCPLVNCNARARLDDTFEVLLDTLVNVEDRTVTTQEATQEYKDYLARLKVHLEQLPLMLTDASESRIAEWRAGLHDLAVFTPEEDLGRETPMWRQRLLSRYLRQLENFATQNYEALPLVNHEWWPALVETTALSLVQVHYLEWQPVDNVMACDNPRNDRLDALTASVRRASAALAVCGARGGCATAEPVQLLEHFDARETGTVASATDFLNAARNVLAGELSSLVVTESDRVELTTELGAFGAGEAIGVTINSGANTCMAADGAWLGLFERGTPNGSGATITSQALARVALTRRIREGTAFLQAPYEAGDYEVRAYAPDERGGAEMARVDLSVWPGPTSCEGFDGIWETDFGELRLFVRGNDVRGTYRKNTAREEDQDPGYFTGELQGNVLYGHWSSELAGGGARLVLMADGQRFRGTWGQRANQFAGTGLWNGRCVAGAE